MLLRSYFCLTLLFTAGTAHGQQKAEITGPEPEGGIENLVNVFYDIEFTNDQLKRIRQFQVKLLIKVTRHGYATLYKVSDAYGQDIEDSLFSRKNSLPYFEPRTVNGEKHPSFYIIRLLPPFDYEYIPEEEANLSFFGIWTKTEDLEYVERGPRMRSKSYGLLSNVFLGSPGKYLLPGIGFFAETRFPLEKRERDLVFGLDLFANLRNGDFPVEPDERQTDAISGLRFSFGYAFVSGLNRLTPTFQVMTNNVAQRVGSRQTIFESRVGLGLNYTRLLPLSGELLRFRRVGYFSQRNIAFSVRSGYYFGGSTVLGRGAMIDFSVAYAINKQSIRKLRYKDSIYEQTKK